MGRGEMHEVYFMVHRLVRVNCGTTVPHKTTKYMVLILSMTYILGSLDCWLRHESWLRCTKQKLLHWGNRPFGGLCGFFSHRGFSGFARVASDGAWNLQILAAPGSHNKRHPGSSKFIAQFASPQCRTRLGWNLCSTLGRWAMGFPWGTSLTWE